MNCGEVLFVGPVGPVLIVVVGACVSTVNAAWAGVASRFRAASTARTSSVCGPSPSDRIVYDAGQLT